MAMSREELLVFITERFNRVEERMKAIEKMVGNITLTVLALNEMIDPLLYKKAQDIIVEDMKNLTDEEDSADEEDSIKKTEELVSAAVKVYKEEAIKAASEQLGRFAAQARIGPSDPASLFKKYGGMP